MKQTIRLTESELRRVIQNTINEELENEDFFDNIGYGFKGFMGKSDNDNDNTFGNLKQSAKNALRNAGKSIQQGATNFGKNMSKRYRSAKEGYQAGRRNDKIQKAIDYINQLADEGILTGNATQKAIQALTANMKMAMGRNKARASAFRNGI